MTNQSKDGVEELLQKYQAGRISREEFRALREAVDGMADSELKASLQRQWEACEDYPPLPREKVEALYACLQPFIETTSPARKRFYGWRIAASVLFLLATGMSVLFFSQRREMQALARQSVTIRSGAASPSSVVLPDGSEVRLNVNTTLSYRQDFGRTDRRVALVGEGCFKVQKGKEGKRFVVQTDYMDITALGTTFNVYAYVNKDFYEMSLLEGSVCVNTVQPPYQTLYARPNEKITYDKRTGELSLERTSNKVETAWISDELVFQHELLREVFRCLERRFNVSFNVGNAVSLHDAYSGSFRRESLEDILDILQQHYGFRYVRKGDSIHIEP